MKQQRKAPELTLQKYNDFEVTHQVLGDMFGVTRMRICQIEKATIQKLKKAILHELAPPNKSKVMLKELAENL